MKYLKQFLIILAFSLVGELLRFIIPLPIPASIYGMLLLFIALMTKLVKLADVKETGKFLIDIMPVMFIPAGVGLMSSWGILSGIVLPILIITVVSLITVMAASGLVSQHIIRSDKKRDSSEKEAQNG